MNDYDETTAFLGHWGRFQQIVFFLLCVSTIPNGSGVLSIVFVAGIPSHNCMVPEDNLTQEWFDAIIPIEVKRCTTVRKCFVCMFLLRVDRGKIKKLKIRKTFKQFVYVNTTYFALATFCTAIFTMLISIR